MNDSTEEKGRTNKKALRCRRCGCRHFYLLSTKRMRRGRIMQRRECRHCGQRVTTYGKEVQIQSTYRSGPQP